jgi:hypothetical protein
MDILTYHFFVSHFKEEFVCVRGDEKMTTAPARFVSYLFSYHISEKSTGSCTQNHSRMNVGCLEVMMDSTWLLHQILEELLLIPSNCILCMNVCREFHREGVCCITESTKRYLAKLREFNFLHLCDYVSRKRFHEKQKLVATKGRSNFYSFCFIWYKLGLRMLELL